MPVIIDRLSYDGHVLPRPAVLLQATLNGDLTKTAHPGVPLSAGELARNAAECVAAGARAMHLYEKSALRTRCTSPAENGPRGNAALVRAARALGAGRS